jgi:eukaryotic-like serine/threonine-protein kinase
LEGVCLAGDYGLLEWLGESDNAAFFKTNYGSDAQPAILKLIPATAEDLDPQLELWNRIGSLSHPNLLRLLDWGRAEQAGDSFLYAVFEFPEETLSAALENAPLDDGEVREIREAVSGALHYLHSQGLVHTAVDTGHIVAVGNQVKLATDTLRPASPDREGADDLAALDHMLPPVPLPETRSPVADAVETAPLPSLPKWAYGALALVLGILGYLFLPKYQPLPVRSVSRPPVVSHPAATPAPSHPPTAPVQPSTDSATSEREFWRVIAYTYSRRQEAQKRVDSINQKWPSAGAECFSPNNGRAPFLVALGGRMTHDDAVRLLKIARGKGLPRDTYIQNYSH